MISSLRIACEVARRYVNAFSYIKWSRNHYDAQRGRVLILVSLRKVELAWKSEPNYIPAKYPDYQGKLAKLRKYIEEGGTALDAPSVSYDPATGFGIIDGRHRVALSRELGLARIYVAVNAEDAKGLKQYLG